jgi:TRAP-type C4-dicarboxylate transport system, small permease component
MSRAYEPQTALARALNALEESAITLFLAVLVALVGADLALRKITGTGIDWALEASGLIFAAMIFFGASYCIKISAHLGVDAILNAVPRQLRFGLSLVAALVCIGYAGLLLKGAWDDWANYANLPRTTGTWLPTGFEEMRRGNFRGWYEVVSIPMPDWLRFIEGWVGVARPYEHLPRFLPYVVMPLSMALMLFRFVEALIYLVRGGDRGQLIHNHDPRKMDAPPNPLNEV